MLPERHPVSFLGFASALRSQEEMSYVQAQQLQASSQEISELIAQLLAELSQTGRG
jgi:hypothetical protein